MALLNVKSKSVILKFNNKIKFSAVEYALGLSPRKRKYPVSNPSNKKTDKKPEYA
jgi:hypothetical protein